MSVRLLIGGLALLAVGAGPGPGPGFDAQVSARPTGQWRVESIRAATGKGQPARVETNERFTLTFRGPEMELHGRDGPGAAVVKFDVKFPRPDGDGPGHIDLKGGGANRAATMTSAS